MSVLSKEKLVERHGEIVCCPQNVECTSICDDCDHMGKMMAKLAEYEDLEEQGLLLRLPVVVGDTVYFFSFGKVFSAEVLEIKYLCEAENYGKFTRQRITIDGDECGIVIIDFSDIGEKYFLTQAEAEEKLK